MIEELALSKEGLRAEEGGVLSIGFAVSALRAVLVLVCGGRHGALGKRPPIH